MKAAVGLFGADTKKVYGMLAAIFPGKTGVPPARGVADFLKAYSTSPWLRAVVSKTADTVSAANWQVLAVRRPGGKAKLVKGLQDCGYVNRKKILKSLRRRGELQVIEKHPALDFIHGGNDHMTGRAVRKLLSTYRDLVGEWFLVKERNVLGAPVSGWPMPPNWIADTPTPQRRSYRVSWAGWQGEIPETEILWFRDHDPYNPYSRGTGMAYALTDELETDEFAAKHLKSFFWNQARPDFAVMPAGEEEWSEPTLREMQQKWMQEHQGFWRRFKPHFFNRRAEIKEIGQTFEQMQMTGLRQWERDVTMQVYGVSPEVFGVIENCHDDQTECLTRRGWVKHTDLSIQDEIATWNSGQSRVEYHRPARVVRFDHDGPMHYWANNRVDVAVTPQHRMWVKHPSEGASWRFETSETITQRAVMFWRITGGHLAGTEKSVHIPKLAYGPTGSKGHEPEAGGYQIPSSAFARFLGYYISEGWLVGGRSKAFAYAQSGISLEVEGLALGMRNAMQALGIGEVRTYTRANRVVNGPNVCMHQFTIANKSMHAWLSENVGSGAASKRIPRCVFDWPAEDQQAFLEAMRDGDGWIFNEQGTFGIASISRELIDDLQQLGVLLGYRTNVCLKNTAGTPTGFGKVYRINHDCWQITFSQHETAYIRASRHLQVRNYKGTVWCVEVPNHLFFTRRNGKVALHGNSNRATIDAADYLVARYVAVPRLEEMRDFLQKFLAPEYDERMIVDYESPVQEDKEFYLKVAQALPSIRNVDEWRDLGGLEELEGGKGKIYPVNQSTFFVRDLEEKMELEPIPEEPPSPPGEEEPGAEGGDEEPAEEGEEE